MNNISLAVSTNVCTGCGACGDNCPTECIKYTEDEEGFTIPIVDFSSCISCGACIKHCHALNYNSETLNRPNSAVLFASNNPSIYRLGASGGAFGELAYIFDKIGYKIYGSVFDDDFIPVHRMLGENATLDQMQGSKYVQSNTIGIFREIKQHLSSGEKVLFSGTPCQVSGLKCYLGSMDCDLLTVDIVCHGVPSPMLWQFHLHNKYYELKRSLDIRFRNKVKYDRYGYVLQFSTSSRDVQIPYTDDVFYSLFMKNFTLRECCYRCGYACVNRISDITLGDCATISKYPSFNDIASGSLVLANTEKGQRAIEIMLRNGKSTPVNLDHEVWVNRQLHAPASRPKQRDVVYKDLLNLDYSQFSEKYLPKFEKSSGIKAMVKRKVSWQLKQRIRTILGRE